MAGAGERLERWDRHPLANRWRLPRTAYLVDLVIAGVYLWQVSGLLSLVVGPTRPVVPEDLAAAAVVLALAVRQRFVRVAFLIGLAGTIGEMVELRVVFASLSIGVPLLLYTVAHRAGRVFRLGAVVVVVVVVVVESALQVPAWSDMPAVLIWVGSPCLVGYLVGSLRQGYAERLDHERQRLALLDERREQQLELAVAAERTRIAREMHDVVSHAIAVMVAQADGGAYCATAAPERAAQTFTTIADTGRGTLAEMRRLLGLLRADPSAGPERTPRLDDVEPLVTRVRSAGLDVDLEVTGRPRAVPEPAEHAVYRLVQEALTNVLKHAGSQATVQVRFVWTDQELQVEVVDDGPGGAAATPAGDGGATAGTPGQGLVGMRERLAGVGGTVDAGPGEDGGFRVRAVLPLVGQCRG